MIVVFLSFVASPVPSRKMLGLGLADRDPLDATIVRMVLVPATMALLGAPTGGCPGRSTAGCPGWSRSAPAVQNGPSKCQPVAWSRRSPSFRISTGRSYPTTSYRPQLSRWVTSLAQTPGSSQPPGDPLLDVSGTGLRSTKEAVACRDHHCRRSGAQNGSDYHVAGIVHAGVDSRVGDPAREQSDRDGQAWQLSADGVGERERRRCVSGRNELDFGMGTLRAVGRSGSRRSGRRRLAMGFRPRLTVAEVTPMATTPSTAARRPRRPPSSAIAAAMPSHRRTGWRPLTGGGRARPVPR